MPGKKETPKPKKTSSTNTLETFETFVATCKKQVKETLADHDSDIRTQQYYTDKVLRDCFRGAPWTP